MVTSTSCLTPGGLGGCDALSDEVAEAGVGGVLPDALALRERQRAEVEVLRSPAQRGRVERDHQRARVDGLGSLDQAVDERLVGAPVELHPSAALAHRRSTFLHRGAALVGEDVGDVHRCGRARDVQVAVRVEQRSCAHRCQQDRGAQPRAEEVDGEVTTGDPVGHPGHDGPAVERRTVVPHRAPLAGSTRDVGPPLGGAGPLRAPFELGEVGRHRWPSAEHPRAIDRALPFASESDGGSGGVVGHAKSFRRMSRTTLGEAADLPSRGVRRGLP